MPAPIGNQVVTTVQKQLNAHFNAGLVEDGMFGPLTRAALLQVPTVSSSWCDKRKFIGAIQYFATMAGIEAGPIDGFWGPQTEYAYGQLKSVMATGKQDLWRDEVEPAYDWPRARTADMNRYFGPVGQNMAKVSVPYTLKLAWAPETYLNRFTCHKLVVEPIQAAMEEILDYYTLDGIKDLRLDMWGGCLNVRKMRGGSNYSMHSWGAAIDWNPANNRLRWDSRKATLALPEYEEFWKAWERQGGVSLGRVKNFDWMHIQFCNP